MIQKCVLFLFVLGSIDAEYYRGLAPGSCPMPRLDHGRVRMRQRSKLAKFTCLPRYELVGNKYATCRDGQWDVPLPVCVRPSCTIPKLPNGLRVVAHGGAWVIFFCLPNHELVGSPVIFCDGMRWNASAPSCVDATSPPKLSCDFEDSALCGWRQDDRHDFDWERRNSKTPSSFLFTGPSYDHTLGKGEYGHYMYIESSSRFENETARLISPVYDSSLATDGCFSFAYHMYGKTCGGLRVYQKPDNLTLRRMLDMPEEEKQAYLLFEKWGNLGDTWFNSVTTLKSAAVDFQIVIEGIRGSSYTSDIAIDDVAILQGDNCTAAEHAAVTPGPPLPDSCVDRCSVIGVTGVIERAEAGCSCAMSCVARQDCCQDFFDICIFAPDTTTPESSENTTLKSSNEEAPQTLKLVSFTSEPTTTTTTITTTTTPATTTTSTTTPRPTTSTAPTTKLTTKVTTTTKRPTTPRKLTIKPTRTTPIPTTTKTTTRRIVTKPAVTPLRTTVPPVTKTTVDYKVKPIPDDSYLAEEKKKKEQFIERRPVNHKPFIAAPQPSGTSTGAKVTIVILVLAVCSIAGLALHALRSPRARVALARLRGRRSRDPEVRYLSSDVDDD